MLEMDFDRTTSSLDELFRRSASLRTGKKFYEMLNFIKKFRNYSVFNNALVYLQNPNITFYATASDWYHKFGRYVKPDARAMVILAPMTPVLLVYDLDDTGGDNPLPEYLTNPFETKGNLPPECLEKTIYNLKRDHVEVIRNEKSSLSAGCVGRYHFKDHISFTVTDSSGKRSVEFLDSQDTPSDKIAYKLIIEINKEFDANQIYQTMCHEIAHLYLGHLGADKDEWWFDRQSLTVRQMELEAEATSFLVCERAGLETKSAEYLSGYLSNEQDVQAISIDLIVKIAGLIERMGKEKLPPRKRSNAK